MKKIFCIISFIFLLSSGLRGQEGLLIKNIRSGKAWMYEKNARVTYIRFQDQEYSTAILKALLDSAVVFGKDTVPLKDIAGVRKKNRIHNIARIAGMPLMLIGSLFMGQGAASVYSNHESGGGIQLFLLGAVIFSLGYLPYEMNLNELTVGIGGQWTVEISRAAK